LSDFPQLLTRAPEFLAPSEAKYFASLKFLRRQQSYLTGRYAAKLALQVLLQEQDLRKIEIYPGIFGQPLVSYLTKESPGITISHGDTLAVALAYPAGHPMGIDVEQVELERLEVIQTQMSPRELQWARSVAAEELMVSTLIWTAKESLSKAVTCGLTSPMEIFNLSEFVPTGNKIRRGFFENFSQYKVLSFAHKTVALSIVLPKNSNLVGEPPDFDRLISAGLGE
jgi:4'-phosphopantetheinyl transferase